MSLNVKGCGRDWMNVPSPIPLSRLPREMAFASPPYPGHGTGAEGRPTAPRTVLKIYVSFPSACMTQSEVLGWPKHLSFSIRFF